MPIGLKFKASLDDSAFMAGVRRIKTASVGLGRGVGRAGRGIGGFAGGATGLTGLTLLGSAAGAGMASKKLIDQADALDKLTAKTGISVESLAKLQGMAATTDVSLEEMSSSIVRMQRNLAGQSKATEQALTDMGLSFKDLKDLAPEEEFMRIGKALNQMDDQQKKAAASMAIFGRGGANLFELFRDMETVDMSAVNKNAKSIADATKILAPLADQLNVAKFAVTANAMKGLGKTVEAAQHLLGMEKEEALPPVEITGKAFRDTLGVGRKEQGLNTLRQGFGRLAPSSGLGIFGTEEGMGLGGAAHSRVSRGDAARARAAQAAIQKRARDEQKASEQRDAIKEALESIQGQLEDALE